MTDEPSRLSTEITHVLFLDMAGYSRLSMEEQARLTQELRAVVRGTPEFARATQRQELIGLDTGDGMALVFFRDPLAPVQCAAEVARALGGHPRLKLRMGIHSGPVSRVPDINGKDNVTGSGINTAQRVMDCGDPGHILLSAASADVVREFEAWTGSLRDLGECEVKHGQRLHLYNLVLGEVGNSQPPSRLTCSPAVPVATAATPPTTPPRAAGSAQKVVLLYKRGAADDERLLALLEKTLREGGDEVFIDRHLKIGVAWAQEIERRIRESDAVVVLLSESSRRSEMLEYEVQTARQAAQAQGGKPRLLPVRVGFTGPLGEPLGAIMDPLHYSLWEGEADDARVVGEVAQALHTPPPAPVPVKREPVGGAVPLDSKFYVVRPTDDAFLEAIAQQDSIVLVKGARQMGKTSLLARGLQQARKAGARVVLSDFQTLGAAALESLDALLLTLAESIADQLDLDADPRESWNAARAPNTNMERFLRREVLGMVTEPLVWGLDEVDRLFPPACDFGSEVFGLFRSWHNRRALDPSGPWSRLTLAIAYATEAHLFITDLNQSPFNVGTRLTLEDFGQAQVADLNSRYGLPLPDGAAVARFFQLVGGQPYLVRRGLDEISRRGLGIGDFEAEADRDEGLFGDHLRRILITLSQDAGQTEAVQGLLRGRPCPTPESFYRLRSAGLIAGTSAADAGFRCRLYEMYLGRHLL